VRKPSTRVSSRRITLLANQPRDSAFGSIDQLARRAEDEAEPERPAAHTHGVGEEVHQHVVDDDEGEEDAEALPLVVVVDVERVHVLPPVAVRAVAAVRGRVRVDQVARAGDVGDEVARVLAAGLARRGVEVRRLDGGALDLGRGEDAGEHAAQPPGHRVDVVHPVLPERGVCAVRADDTVEEVDHDEEEGEDL